MNDKTAQALTDALIDQIESAARASFRRHQGRIKGQLLTAADNYDWHLLHAAYQAGIHAMRAQLAEAQDALQAAQRLFKEALPKFNWGASFLDANAIQLLNEVPAKVNAAIDAAKGESNG